MPTSRRRLPLPRRNQQRAAALVEIALGESERLLDVQSGSPHGHDQSPQAATVGAVPGGALDGDDLLDLRRIGR
jgi:hypothetical protein